MFHLLDFVGSLFDFIQRRCFVEILICGKIETIDLTNERWVLLKVGHKRFAQNEHQVNEIKNKPIGSDRLSLHHFLLLKVETGGHPQPFKYSVFAFWVFHELLYYVCQMNVQKVKLLANFIHMLMKLVLFHSVEVEL